MSYYPATIVFLDADRAQVRIDATGHMITLRHDEHNAVPVPLRAVGTRGVISFPKAPPHFAAQAA
jgi:hypothetical protein